MGCNVSKLQFRDNASVKHTFKDTKHASRNEPVIQDFSEIHASTQEEATRCSHNPTELSSDSIEDILQRLPEGELFEDPYFPASPTSLFFNPLRQQEATRFTWQRPHELCPSPSLYVDGTSRRDVIQGILGDCWLLSTCAALAKREDLLYRVLPPHQPLQGPKYNGAVLVLLWRYGKWIKVWIDDRLPQLRGGYVYGRCSDPREFWVAMIEKAFAKLHGSFEALEGGMPIEAMVDLTGGLAERYELKEYKMHLMLYQYLRRSFAAQAFITCSRKGDWREANKADQNGLVQGHAYTITGLYRADNEERTRLIRVRNPWGDNNEWKGDWCDGHLLWQTVSERTKRDMGLQYQADGEFWMDFFADFVQQFEEVSICTLGPDFNADGCVDSAGSVHIHKGAWEKGFSAGGCRNNLVSFSTNPQFILSIPENLSTSNNAHVQPKSQVIISLAQEHLRVGQEQKIRLLQIGFCLYKVSQSTSQISRKLDDHFFRNHQDKGTSGPYINYREVFARFELSPGTYVIIPATFEADSTGSFMLRVYAVDKVELKRLA